MTDEKAINDPTTESLAAKVRASRDRQEERIYKSLLEGATHVIRASSADWETSYLAGRVDSAITRAHQRYLSVALKAMEEELARVNAEASD